MKKALIQKSGFFCALTVCIFAVHSPTFGLMFFLTFNPTPSRWPLHLSHPIFCIGSCFAQEMHQRLVLHKFQSTQSPLGTLYNPLSIFSALEKSVGSAFDATDTVAHHGVWYHWDAHSEQSALSQSALMAQITTAAQQTKEALQNARWLIITFGTAHVYRRDLTGKVVANCHKRPAAEFTKELLTVQEIVQAYAQLMHIIRHHNPSVQVILTVSPVRHIRDGLVENNHSKAILLQAVHEMTRIDPHTQYFPAYELQMDVLRDYRFYKADLIHPTAQAVDYIWDAFLQAYLDEASRTFVNEWKKILKALEHRAFHPASAAHQQFLKDTLLKLDKWAELVDVTSEQNVLRSQLTS